MRKTVNPNDVIGKTINKWHIDSFALTKSGNTTITALVNVEQKSCLRKKHHIKRDKYGRFQAK